MKRNRMSSGARLIILLCGILLLAVEFFPMWQIQLSAPQYPEGLILLIFPNKLGGNVDIINGLNHYIGMKPLHTSDFGEFKILPYIVGFFSAGLIVTAAIGNRMLFRMMFLLFVAFSVLAMVDFWKWEYDYGHNLNPDAAIVVPGMAYQPPLIGFKQLLNFQAFSIPDVGGWLFISAGVLMAGLWFFDWFFLKKRRMAGKAVACSILVFFSMQATSCSQGPQPIVAGRDNCDYCRMMVSDPRFGGEILTSKGKVYKFDDMHCLLFFLQRPEFNRADVKQVYLVDFTGGHNLIKAEECTLFKSDQLKSPMGGNTAAFSNVDSAQVVSKQLAGTVMTWNETYKK